MIPIHLVLKNFIEANLDNEEFVKAYLVTLWNKIMGADVARVTGVASFAENKLIINVYEQEWLKVLSKMENELKDRINSFLPKALVEHIEFKRTKKSVKKTAHLDASYGNEKDGNGSKTLKEAELIPDSELKEHFKKAYKNLQKIKKN
jgi:Dna[CI] antecedent, DciA